MFSLSIKQVIFICDSNMSFRPAGYSSDEDEDEFSNFSFHGDFKNERERREEIAAEVYNRRLESENTDKYRFYTAVIKSNLDQIKKEIENGIDINSEICSDWTALFLSTSQGNAVVVEELLKNGANVELTRDGLTPLMAICNCPNTTANENNTLTIVNLLLKYKIPVQAKDIKRRTAFMFACAQGFLEVVKVLLPLSELEDSDNQGWTALFYAVNHNKDEIAKYLIENGANVEHLDVRNNNVKYYASLNDFEEILNLFPKSDFDISPDDFANNIYDYESVFDELLDGERPDFKPDISSLLYGMKCQNFIPMFNTNNVELSSFLTLNEEKLKELGVMLSFQRQRILQGLYRFHKYSWKKYSVPFVPVHETFTTHDVFVTITNTIKHLVVLEASIKYLKQNFDFADNVIEKDIVAIKTLMALRKINRIKNTARLLHAKALQFDSTNEGPVDLITNKTKLRKNILNKKIVIGFVGFTTIFLFRYVIARL